MPNDSTETPTADSRLIAWLNEAYAKEAELEADLTAHIGLTQKKSYRDRLERHLEETRQHKTAVGARIDELGASPSAGPEVPLVPGLVGELAGKAVAAVKGQLGAGRALVTAQTETHVRNAEEELREEHVEIALYSRIETFAAAVGDDDTAALARRIIREEERMAHYLAQELERLVKALARDQVPARERAAA